MRMSSPEQMSEETVYSAAISERSRRPAIIGIRTGSETGGQRLVRFGTSVATCNQRKSTIAVSDLGSNRTQGSLEEINGWTQNP
jgi:hypothetical protein